MVVWGVEGAEGDGRGGGEEGSDEGADASDAWRGHTCLLCRVPEDILIG